MISRSTLAPAALLLLALGCSQDEVGAAGPSGSEAALPAPGAAARRSRDPRVVELRAHLDLGRPDAARPLLRALEGQLGVEDELLAARLAALDGQPLEAARRVEDARRRDPDDPRVYATAAELAAAAGRLETAREELRRGLERCRLTPELLRAQGAYELCRPGRARAGLELVERARERDPELPFCARALGQGRLLLAKEALAGGDALGALDFVTASLEHDPEDVEARRFLSDALAAAGDLGAAAGVLQELVDAGQPLQSELALLYKRAGVAGLIQRRRDEALELFRRARDLGLSPEELGTGAMLLAEAAEQRTEAGLDAFEAGELAAARAQFERALEFDPDRLDARNGLGVVLFRLDEPDGAAAQWRIVLAVAEAEGLALPDPVHLNLAKAEFRAGRAERARAALEAYLAREPEGLWAPDTRKMLELLD